MPLHYLRPICEYWATTYGWRRVEEELNRFDQLRFVATDGTGIQVLHAPSPHPAATPIILTHGWPGSVVEFLDVVERLRRPELDGAPLTDAFHVVCPSLPGYGFSDQPAGPAWRLERIADTWVELMAALGYDRFYASGGDWGALVSVQLAIRHPGPCAGIHLTMVPVGPGDEATATTPEELDAVAAYNHYQQWEAGYAVVQSTRPQTIGYALTDSRAGQAAWILEKFWSWTDHPESVPPSITLDRMLDNVMHYWLSSAGASSARLYWESFRMMRVTTVSAPMGATIYPKEILRPTRSWAERRFQDTATGATPNPEGTSPRSRSPTLSSRKPVRVVARSKAAPETGAAPQAARAWVVVEHRLWGWRTASIEFGVDVVTEGTEPVLALGRVASLSTTRRVRPAPASASIVPSCAAMIALQTPGARREGRCPSGYTSNNSALRWQRVLDRAHRGGEGPAGPTGRDQGKGASAADASAALSRRWRSPSQSRLRER